MLLELVGPSRLARGALAINTAMDKQDCTKPLDELEDVDNWKELLEFGSEKGVSQIELVKVI